MKKRVHMKGASHWQVRALPRRQANTWPGVLHLPHLLVVFFNRRISRMKFGHLAALPRPSRGPLAALSRPSRGLAIALSKVRCKLLYVVQICSSSLSAAADGLADGSGERRPSLVDGIELKIAHSCRKVVPKSLPVSATTLPTALSFYIAQGRLRKNIRYPSCSQR